MFLSLGIIFILGFLGGYIFNKIGLPKLIYYILLGVLIGPSLLNIVDDSLLEISSYLRQTALVIILTRSGLSLDFKTLKQIGRPAILMCFVPAVFEITGIAIFGPLLLDLSLTEALLLGSVLGAVSPAIVVPFMIKLQNEKYGYKHNVPDLIMAGASCDDIFVIVLFYSFKNLIKTNNFSFITLLQIPISIALGILLGLLFFFLLHLALRKLKINQITKCIIFLGTSFLMLGIENILKDYVNISSLLGIILLAMLVLKYDKEDAVNIKKSYDSMWNLFEILLFVLVGCATNVNYALSKEGLIILGLIVIALLFRMIGVLVAICFTKYNLKEKLFIAISYLPKATVQASIGGIALSEGLKCGELVLTGAVISILLTAPLGSVLMNLTYKKLLQQEL